MLYAVCYMLSRVKIHKSHRPTEQVACVTAGIKNMKKTWSHTVTELVFMEPKSITCQSMTLSTKHHRQDSFSSHIIITHFYYACMLRAATAASKNIADQPLTEVTD